MYRFTLEYSENGDEPIEEASSEAANPFYPLLRVLSFAGLDSDWFVANLIDFVAVEDMAEAMVLGKTQERFEGHRQALLDLADAANRLIEGWKSIEDEKNDNISLD